MFLGLVSAYEFIRGKVTDGTVRAVGVVFVDSASGGDAGLRERAEVLAVEELTVGAVVERLDEAVLPGQAGDDIE